MSEKIRSKIASVTNINSELEIKKSVASNACKVEHVSAIVVSVCH